MYLPDAEYADERRVTQNILIINKSVCDGPRVPRPIILT